MAAEQGLTNAQYNLGFMYNFGEGVPQNDAEAVKWYQKAVEQGDPWAQNNLGLMYSKGRGVQQNLSQAVKLYRDGCWTGSRRSAKQPGAHVL